MVKAMKKVGLLFVAWGATLSARSEPAEYVIDPDHVTVAFLVEHAGYASVLGQFLDVEGTFVFDEDSGEVGEVDVTIRAESVFSNHDARDDHVRGRDFLDASRHPAIRFTADGARRVGDREFEIDGSVEILGAARPLQLDATWNKSADYPFGRAYVIGVSARTELMRGDFGMTYGLDDGLVGDRVEIIVEFEARRR
jgi:polyisoprenoid-binding protein YceI